MSCNRNSEASKKGNPEFGVFHELRFGFVKRLKAFFRDIKDHVIKLLADTLHSNFSHEEKFFWTAAALQVGAVGFHPHPPHVSSNLVAQWIVHLVSLASNSHMTRHYGRRLHTTGMDC